MVVLVVVGFNIGDPSFSSGSCLGEYGEAVTDELDIDGKEGELSSLGFAGIAAGADEVFMFDSVVDGIIKFLFPL